MIIINSFIFIVHPESASSAGSGIFPQIQTNFYRALFLLPTKLDPVKIFFYQ